MNQEKIIQAIAEYLEENTFLNDSDIHAPEITFGVVKEYPTPTHLECCKELATQIADAIAPHLEAGAGWEDAPSWAEWRTVDGNGDITYWKDKPEPSKRNDYWTLAKGDRYEQIPHTVKDWKETLQKRPR